MKTLIVEDDTASSKLMQAMLTPFGECLVAIDGLEAIALFQAELAKGVPFDLVCLDIMMPDVGGQEVLTTIRALEEQLKILPPKNVKIIMTTALSDKKNILGAFTNQCEAYLIKPIEYEQLDRQIRLLGLVNEAGSPTVT